MMSLTQILSIIMGLLIAGGMLIPGNIPNIVAAGRLKIHERVGQDWSPYWIRLNGGLLFSIAANNIQVVTDSQNSSLNIDLN